MPATTRGAIGLFVLIEGVIAPWLSDPDSVDPVAVVTGHVAHLRAPDQQ